MSRMLRPTPRHSGSAARAKALMIALSYAKGLIQPDEKPYLI
jgi:hypothetical protein